MSDVDQIGGVPGNPDRIRYAVAQLRQYADLLTSVRADLICPTAGDDLQWRGKGSQAYDGRIAQYQGEVDKLRPRTLDAATLLEEYVEKLTIRASQATAIREEWRTLSASASDADKAKLEELKVKYSALVREALAEATRCAEALLRLTTHNDPASARTFDVKELTPEEIRDIQADINRLGDQNYAGWDQASQAGIGDCYLVSALQAMLRTRQGRETLQKNIRWEEGKGFVVTLHPDTGPDAGKAVEVVVTDTYDGGVQYSKPPPKAGILDIYERAYGQYYGWQDLNDGGYGSEVMTRVTGKEARLDFLPPGSAKWNETWNRMQPAVAQGRPVTAGSRGNLSEATDVLGVKVRMVPSHEYAVTGLDANSVTLHNPHGDNGPPGSSPIIRLSRPEFQEGFRNVSVGDL